MTSTTDETPRVERVAIVGSRRLVREAPTVSSPTRADILSLVSELGAGTVIVTGGALGVDRCAASAAKWYGLGLDVITPDYSNAAAPKLAPKYRNWEIARSCDRMFAFWDGYSTGTTHAIACAVSLGKPVEVRTYL